MILENWARKVVPSGGFDAPEDKLKFVEGEVFGHPEMPNGSKVYVELKRFDYCERAFRDAQGRLFRLRQPSPIYEQRFPKAVARLKKAADDRVFVG